MVHAPGKPSAMERSASPLQQLQGLTVCLPCRLQSNTAQEDGWHVTVGTYNILADAYVSDRGPCCPGCLLQHQRVAP
jgi:hypothetical protein